MNRCLLDTDILSEVLRGRNHQVVARADSYLRLHGQFAISAFTRYEVVRGLRWTKASTKLTAFTQLCESMTVYTVSTEVLDRAAELWAIGATLGKPKMDADLLIAATALTHGLELASGNVPHFDWIEKLAVTNWRDP